jgi:DNA-binding helix-hairpin-helix protein with protein kinase domain
MTWTEVYVDNMVIRLGSMIGKGGEGEVYALGTDSKLAVKIYTTPDKALREKKVLSILKSGLSSKAPSVAFPVSAARSKTGEFLGFLMPLVSGHKPLHELYAPGPRKQNFPKADYRFLVRVAANIARATSAVHRANCVIGDINHSSILVSPSALVTLIDADSFQVSHEGENFLCRVGVPEYTPPELQGLRLDGVVRSPNHDAFGLAIVIFQLLFMGRHPFVGTVRSGEIPPLHENIKQFRYVYTDKRNVGMDQPPGTPSITDFSPMLADLFDRSFSPETKNNRPSAESWITALTELERALTKCEENDLHFISKDASDCAWCEMEKSLGTILFIPDYSIQNFSGDPLFPIGGAFDLKRVWASIEAIRLPARSSFKPKFSNPTISPSSSAKAASEASKKNNSRATVGWGFIAASIVGIFALKPIWVYQASALLFIIWIVLLGYGIARIREKSGAQVDVKNFEQAYVVAVQRLDSAIDAWYTQIGFKALGELKASLEAAKSSYEALISEERTRISLYQAERREKQLLAFLGKFAIQNVKLRGIGPAGKATLASYGIDSAADVSEAKLSGVPGFRGAKKQTLIAWRQSLAGRFTYNAVESDDDRREIALIKSSVGNKAASLRVLLTQGPRRLECAIDEVGNHAGRHSPTVDAANLAVEQAKVDLIFLGIATPNVPPIYRAPSQNPPATRNSPSSANTATIGGSSSWNLSCPRCGSKMAKRLARRGKNAGKHFLGCTRYPVCRGTRNV